jgi:hypothetical protein
LPDATEIERLDQTTIIASIISGGSFMMCLGVILYLHQKKHA